MKLVVGTLLALLSYASAGPLVVIGGALEATNAPIYEAVIAGTKDGPICVLGTASSDPAGSAQSYVRDFRGYGAEAVSVAITVDNAAASTKNPKNLEQLRACGGYFFVGGDQRRITEAFFGGGGGATPALRTLRNRFKAGAVVAGTSAGAAMMSQEMITGGSSLDTLLGSEDHVTLDKGLGFENEVIFDQHFVERGRFGRLIGALSEAGLRLGAGVGEDTALIVPDSGPWRVVGSGHVVVLELPPQITLDRLSGIKLSLIAAGDRFNPDTGRFTIAKARENIADVGYYYDAGDIFAVDIFGPGVLADLAERLVDSPEEEASGLAFAGAATPRFTSDGVRVVLRKTPQTVGYWGDLDVGEGYSVVRLGLTSSMIKVAVEPAEAP